MFRAALLAAALSVLPSPAPPRLDSDLFTAVEAAVQSVYRVPTLPSMSTYATDMWLAGAR